MKIKRAEKYGFCSGVRIADLKVKRFAAAGGRGAILGQVVHNERVVEEMEKLGVRTVDDIAAVRGADHRLLRARRPAVVSRAARRRRPADPRHDLQVRLRHPSRGEGGARRRVSPRLHRRSEAPRGDRLHERSRSVDVPHRLDRSKRRRRSTGRRTRRSRSSTRRRSTPRSSRTSCGPSSGAPRAWSARDTICYATKENQDAARVLAHDPEVDVIIVIGGKKSANTKHLWEICREIEAGVPDAGRGRHRRRRGSAARRSSA